MTHKSYFVENPNRVLPFGEEEFQMIKTFGPTTRVDTLTREEYVAYYTGQQVQYAKVFPGRVKYYANPAVQGATGGDPPWDSVAESYWPNVETIRAIMTSAQWNAARADHLNGIIGRLMFTSTETEFENRLPADYLKDGKPRVKYLAFLNRADGMTRDDFQEYWFKKHVPLALKTPQLQRYRACVTGISLNGDSLLKATPDPAPFDGVVEMWFESLESFRAVQADEHWDRLRQDYYKGFAMGRMHLLVRENLVYG
jgi:uncharacterized protein (TIGR02118 family)